MQSQLESCEWIEIFKQVRGLNKCEPCDQSRVLIFFFRKELEEFAIKSEKEKDMKRELEEKVIKL